MIASQRHKVGRKSNVVIKLRRRADAVLASAGIFPLPLPRTLPPPPTPPEPHQAEGGGGKGEEEDRPPLLGGIFGDQAGWKRGSEIVPNMEPEALPAKFEGGYLRLQNICRVRYLRHFRIVELDAMISQCLALISTLYEPKVYKVIRRHILQMKDGWKHGAMHRLEKHVIDLIKVRSFFKDTFSFNGISNIFWWAHDSTEDQGEKAEERADPSRGRYICWYRIRRRQRARKVLWQGKRLVQPGKFR